MLCECLPMRLKYYNKIIHVNIKETIMGAAVFHFFLMYCKCTDTFKVENLVVYTTFFLSVSNDFKLPRVSVVYKFLIILLHVM